ncbi:hypothetical protein [Pedobacter jeongneungensis]|uniref:hypothetical protein n=1 Tax=Pedobacter jeongneungensis TaxID=947309 RepID=UPI000468906F|nr:hypothetical protein [Pedobacter jeongneungensis]
METLTTTLNEITVTQYLNSHHHIPYERELLNEILQSIQQNDLKQLNWFAQFGNGLRSIVFNVYAYRCGLKFGFTEINFDEYGWFKRPLFLDQEELCFGLIDKNKSVNYSTITLGRGPNNIWSFGMSISYGTAGSSSGICVYSPIFNSKSEALNHAIQKLKNAIVSKVGDKDTTNYNQKIIRATLKDIETFRNAKSQMSLF